MHEGLQSFSSSLTHRLADILAYCRCCYSCPLPLALPAICRCAEAAEGIAASLDARLQALPKQPAVEGGDAGAVAAAAACYAPSATQALILGRVALGMAGRSRMLPRVLGPPDQWRAAVQSSSADAASSRATRRPGAGSAAPAAAAAAPSARYERLQHRLHSVGLQAYGTWAGWASAGLSAALAAGLAADHTLAADAPLRSWEETVIGGGTDAAAADLADASLDAPSGGLEMRFQLPAAPSPAAVQLALAACQEADRAGMWLLLLCCAPELYGQTCACQATRGGDV
jgi:hypothetical protein